MNYEDYGVGKLGKREESKVRKEVDFDNVPVSGSLGDAVGVGKDMVIAGHEGKMTLSRKDEIRSEYGRPESDRSSDAGLVLKDPSRVKVIKADGTIDASKISGTFKEIKCEGDVEFAGELSLGGKLLMGKPILNYVVPEIITDAGDYTTATEHDYTDWDVKSLTSPTAVRVHLRIYFLDDTAGSYVIIRKNGNVAVAVSNFLVETYVANIPTMVEAVMDLDTNQTLEVKTSDNGGAGPVTTCWISVIGWWEPL